MSDLHIGDTTVSVVKGDITTIDVDVVVNAANERLVHGGGVAAAISRAGGPTVQEESTQWVRQHGELGPGRAAITSAGEMPAQHVVHVVGPRYRGTRDDETDLRAAVSAALAATRKAGGRSVAFPAISTGIFGYPTAAATEVIVRELIDWLESGESGIERVLLVGFDEGTVDAFQAAIESARPNS